MTTLSTLSLLLVQTSLEGTLSIQVSALSFLFCIQVGDGVSNSQKCLWTTLKCFFPSYHLFTLSSSKEAASTCVQASTAKQKVWQSYCKRESASTWKRGAGPAPEVGGGCKGTVTSREGRMPSKAWPRCFSRPQGRVYFSRELGQSAMLGVAATTGGSGGASPTIPGAGSAPGSPCPPSPWGAELSHSHAVIAGICCPQMNFNV